MCSGIVEEEGGERLVVTLWWNPPTPQAMLFGF